ncbi:hypothetical protein D3C81_1677390 [compost metagenome]
MVLGTGDEVDQHLRIAGGLEDGACLLQLPAQLIGIHQIAVGGNGQIAAAEAEHQRLRILQLAGARCGIAHVPDSGGALQ